VITIDRWTDLIEWFVVRYGLVYVR